MTKYYRGLIVVLLVVGVICVASVSQLFGPPAGWLYDQAVQLPGWDRPSAPRVLIVEIDASASSLSGDDWLKLLKNLEDLNAEQVVLGMFPKGADARFYQQAIDSGNVIFGRSLVHAPRFGDAPALEDWPAALDELEPPFGILWTPPAGFGVHRRAATRVNIQGRDFPTLEMAAAVALRASVGDLEGKEFLVNFNQGSELLPRVAAERVLNDGLIPELVAGRSVLIGLRPSPSEPRFYTPVSQPQENLSLLSFQAYALDTLLAQKSIRTTTPVLKLALLFAIVVLGLAVYQCVSLTTGSWLTLLMVSAYLVLGWVLVHRVWVWIPVFEMAFAQLLIFVLFVRFKLLKDDQEVRKVLLEQAAKLRYSLPTSFYQTQEYWEQVITLLDQVLNLRWVILLEKIQRDHRVREVQVLRCSLDDIDGRRRDYGWTPYRRAIAEGGPIRLEQRMYLKTQSQFAEDQYLVPLSFGGEVQGFWAFGVDPAIVEASGRFLSNVRDFGGQIAELLYHRHRRQEQEQADASAIRRFFRLQARKDTYQEVQEMLVSLDRSLSSLEAVFDGKRTATILYDLFGRVVQLNRGMERFMQKANLPCHKMTALDLLVAVSGVAQAEARSLLQQAIIDRNEFQLPVKLGAGNSENFSVQVRPLAAHDTATVPIDEVSPFQLSGILFEFVDITRFNSMFEVQRQVLERVQHRLRKDTQAFFCVSCLLQESLAAALNEKQWMAVTAQKVVGASEPSVMNCPTDLVDVAPVVGVLEDKISGILTTLEKAQAALALEICAQSTHPCPVDARPMLIAVSTEQRDLVSKKRINFDWRMPEFMGLVLAQPEQLKNLFRTLLEVLLNDAATNTEIVIQVTEREESILYEFNNVGFGIPDGHLQKYLSNPEFAAAEEFLSLREAIRPVADWEGNVTVNSEVGVGIWSKLLLKIVI